MTREHSHEHRDHDDGDEESLIQHHPMQVFDSKVLGEPVPEGFDAVRIRLDGTMKSLLNWHEEIKAAGDYISQGLKIFWELDLGLNAGLALPMANRGQFLSLSLSLEHFCKEIWSKQREATFGLCLYRGPLDLSKNFEWDDVSIANFQDWLKEIFTSIEAQGKVIDIDWGDLDREKLDKFALDPLGKKLMSLFCSEAIGEYLQLLAQSLPDPLACFLLFHADGDDSFLAALLSAKERYSRFLRGVRGFPDLSDFGFDGPACSHGRLARDAIDLSSAIGPLSSLGFCLPSINHIHQEDVDILAGLYRSFSSSSIIPRAISQSNLTAEWEQLDTLVVASCSVDATMLRKLKGFSAAGGTVAVVGKPIGLNGEIAALDFFRNCLPVPLPVSVPALS